MSKSLLVALVLWSGCKTTSAPTVDDDPPAHADMPADVTALAKAGNQFAFDLWHRVATKPANLAISPASITTALAMTWGGANGATAAEMQAVLRFDGDAKTIAPRWGQLSRALQDPGRALKLQMANRLFGEQGYPFERAFLDATKSAYGAALEPLSFTTEPDAARGHINAWVEGRTEHRIKDLLPPQAITTDTRLVLVNAIYFLAEWASPFTKEGTSPQDFTVGATKKPVPTMHGSKRYRYAKADNVAVLELPYRGNDTAMLVILPDRADGLADLERTIDATKLAAWSGALEADEVIVSLPKFVVDPKEPLALAQQLAALGMRAAFDPSTADFFGIATPPDPAKRLFISAVFHKAFVKVDEKGTEAAAATAVVAMDGAGAPPPHKEPIRFTADHPFMFAIVDTTSGLVLFLGRVADPG
jgi:serpin B